MSLFLLLLSLASAVSPDSTDAAEIMNAVERRDEGDKMTARLHITIKDKAGRERTRTVSTRTMKFEGGNKQLMLFEAPADVRNAGLLSVDYDQGDKSDDQWLYLPSLGKTTRISSADKSGSFMGTDLTYADMTTKDPTNYEYSIVEQSAVVDGEECWVIEARPTTDKEQTETGYLKTHVWVSKSKQLAVQMKAWVREGKKLKYMKFGELKQIDGIWIPHQIVVRTVRAGEVESQSTITFSDLLLNVEEIVESDFTERRLEQGL